MHNYFTIKRLLEDLELYSEVWEFKQERREACQWYPWKLQQRGKRFQLTQVCPPIQSPKAMQWRGIPARPVANPTTSCTMTSRGSLLFLTSAFESNIFIMETLRISLFDKKGKYLQLYNVVLNTTWHSCTHQSLLEMNCELSTLNGI